jgi:predicted DNA-binding WGR domain protein
MANVSDGDFFAAYRSRTCRPCSELARWDVLSIELTLFAKHTLIRRWGRIGCPGRERLQFFGSEDASLAQVSLDMAHPTHLSRRDRRR